MTLGLINANPVVHAKKERIARPEDHHAVDALDIYDFVRDIRDPEHPYSLEQLSVLSEESITVDEKLGRILITFTPTIQHCSMANVIGLCLREKLKNCFPPHFKVDIKVAPGSHADEDAVVYGMLILGQQSKCWSTGKLYLCFLI
ncbi:PREDICTED: protein AE7-like 1 isoform X2 [Nicotiana attenuata]|uniref:protein AE7-like 1 isoform X2 n=1 Tax=Nicotiana attenuata TaxID=49451 RepID=UPI000905425D|nr:PREDICTED: protein AE7-like 1 isoform X2 [Nicotiana attenuata]